MTVLWGPHTVTEAVLPRPTRCRKTSGRVLHVGVRLGFLRQGSNWSWWSFWELLGFGGNHRGRHMKNKVIPWREPAPHQYLWQFMSHVGGGDESLVWGAPMFLSEPTTVFQMCLSKLALSLSPEFPWCMQVEKQSSCKLAQTSCGLQSTRLLPAVAHRWEPRVPTHTSLPGAAEVPTSLPFIFLFMRSMRKHMCCLVSAALRPFSYCWTL